MNRTVLQVPMTPILRSEAEKVARKQGYSSLQDAVRIYLHKLAREEVQIKIQEQFPPVQLSPKAVKRYDKMTEDYKKERNIFVAESVEDLMDQLNGVKAPVSFKVSKAFSRKNISKQGSGRSIQRGKRIIYG